MGFGKGCHLHLIDGSAFIFRAYHALPPLTRKSDGLAIGAVAGFCNMLARYVDGNGSGGRDAATHAAVVFDFSAHTFRNDLYPLYKAQRPEPPEDLRPQFPLTRDATRAFNLPALELEGFEADDIIATLARQAREAGGRVTILSSDKDLMQLIGGGVEMLDPMKNRRIGPDEVVEKFGVGPERVVDVQALSGDSVDNIPGAPGIGIKTAAQLIAEFGDLESLLARAAEIPQPKRRAAIMDNIAQIRLSRRLVTLEENAPLPFGLDELEVRPPHTEALLEFLARMEFRTLSRRVAEKMGVEAPAIPEPVLDPAAQAAPEGQAPAAVPFDPAAYVPLGHVTGGGDLFGAAVRAPDQIDRDAALAILRPMLEDAAVLKIGQNMKYDWKILARQGIRVAPIDDTMLMSYALHAGLHGHGMDALSESYLGHVPIPIKPLLGAGKAAITFDRVPIADAAPYAAEDADITLRLWQAFAPRLHRAQVTTVYQTLERPLVPVLAEMEMAGVLVDRAALSRMSGVFAQRMAALEDEIQTLAGERFNVASPKQLGEILFDRMGLPGGEKGKTGAYATGADILEDLAAEGHELPARVLDWRQLAKLKSTYTDALQAHINPETGRVHTSYVIAGANTGRLASTDPNLQNIPVRTDEGRRIREAFVAPPGRVLVSLDYSQIELRILAHVADIPALREAFREGKDIHAMTASEMFGVPIEGMDPMVRRQAKAINFGVIYGISGFGLARNLRIPRDQAQRFIDTYFERFPGIRRYMDDTVATARAHGYVTTLFGRRIHTPEINAKGPTAGFARRAAINAPIQGAAADIIRRAMIRVPAAISDLPARMLLQVHDELLFEVDEGAADTLIARVREVMEGAADPVVRLDVPLVVDAGRGPNWAAAH